MVEQFVVARGSCYPIEECLQICQEFKQLEAVFLLSKKLGKYFDCITQGVTFLQSKIDQAKLLVEIYYCKQNGVNMEFQMPKSKKN